ncbi:MAG: hypothetical protein H6709_05080 [Kofleriaceae bacterium]|nr:hypothetical protein [Myxococcales bacterium]MCB9559834.1 hypothetical protein [Kofleriaceae bacterium]MCB9571445.1 hypothetical protein [Kofleriaceae bacterium]
MAEDLASEYDSYLQRFDAQVGEQVDVGAFAKFKGKLIKKLDAAEFAETYREYHELAGHYFESIDRGDTINDAIVKIVREAAAKLVLTAPV